MAKIEQENLATKKAQYAADLKAGIRDKAHHEFWEATRARLGQWDAGLFLLFLPPFYFLSLFLFTTS